jgi:copper(I)-binding protein
MLKLVPRSLVAICLLGASCILMPAVRPSAAVAQDYLKDVMTVAGAWAKATPPDSQTTAVYLTILNNSDDPDKFVGATTPIADKVEIRDSANKNVVLSSVTLKHSDGVSFKPGGIHLLLTGLKHQLVPHEKFPITLFFLKATKVDAEVTVTAPDSKLQSGIDENSWQ